MWMGISDGVDDGLREDFKGKKREPQQYWTMIRGGRCFKQEP